MNSRLPVHKQIIIKDISNFVNAYRRFGKYAETFDPLVDRLKNVIVKGGLPFLLLTDSISGQQFGKGVRGLTTEEYGHGFLRGFFKKDVIM